MMLFWVVILTGVAQAFGAEGDWPRFRGPNGSGVAESARNLPVEVGPGKNVAWKVGVPFGRSSPIVVNGSVVVVTAAEGEMLVTLALDAGTGKQLWRREVRRARAQKTYPANDPASPTPASDGENVYAFFPELGLISYRVSDGVERWRLALGPFENFYGIASSPVVANGMVLLLCDQARDSYLLAVDAASGKQRWKRERPGIPEGWSVPVVVGDQVVAVGTTRVDSYWVTTGESRWWLPLGSNGAMGTPVVHGDAVIVTGAGSDQPWMPSFAAVVAKCDRDKDGKVSREEGKDEKEWFEHFGWVDANHDGLLEGKEWETARSFGVGDYGAVAIPLNGKGRLDGAAVRWRFKRNLPYVPAPVLYQGIFYMGKNGGILTSLDGATGEVRKQGRSPQAPGQYLASPVAGDGKVYFVSEEGKLTVLRAGAEWEVLGVSDLGEECYATPAISGERLFVRTRGALYAFAVAQP